MDISIFGLGYVGCVGLGCLADSGHNIVGVDVNKYKVDLINNGKATIVENEIDEIIKRNRDIGRIRATLDSIEAVLNTDIAIICVGTPNDTHGHLDMKFIESVSEEIGRGIKEKSDFFTVALRSTVMPGTNIKVGKIIEEISGKKLNKDFSVVSNPEFLREGSAVKDFFNPPYTVVASESDKAIDIMKEVYQSVKGDFIRTDIGSAELIKFVNNSFHALKVVFANEVGRICKSLNIDSHNLMNLFVKDEILNISPYYFKPGFAYGGSCLPKDLKGLQTLAHDLYLKVPVIDSIDKTNEIQIQQTIEMIESFNKKRLGFLGLSFKAGTDDLRNSPSVKVIELLLGKGYEITIYDKNVLTSCLTGTNKEYIETHIPHLSKLIVNDIETVINNSDIVVICTKENEFIDAIDNIKGKCIVDLIYLNNKIRVNNIYYGISW